MDKVAIGADGQRCLGSDGDTPFVRAMSDYARHLILVNHPMGQDVRDFEEIAARIADIAPETGVFIVATSDSEDDLPDEIWRRPALTVSMMQTRRFWPKRGPFYQGLPVPKFIQMERFAGAGLNVPVTARYAFGRSLEPSRWGPHVVLKTAVPGASSKGDCIFVLPARRVAALAPVLFPPGHKGSAALLVQQFIDTGDTPESLRVLTLFGEPLLAMIYRAHEKRPPLDAPEEVLLGGPFASNADPHFSCLLVELEEEVLAIARRAARALPRIPLLGLDIVREARTGRLYVLEANPGGNTWHFSSKLAEEGRKEISREQRIGQMDAWGVAARVLAERTRAEAS